MAEWKKDIVHSCYGCPMYYNDTGYKNWPNYKHCGGNHYECDYFCNGGKPNVGVYAKELKGGGGDGL